MTTIYHVAKQWDGSDLLSLQLRYPWSEEVAEMIAARWPDNDPRRYYLSDGEWVHCHATRDEAIAYRDEWCEGGVILAIDADDLDVQVGSEYPHPVVFDRIAAELIQVSDIDG